MKRWSKSLLVLIAVCLAAGNTVPVQAFDRPCYATAATQTWKEGDSVPCSTDLSGSMRMQDTKLRGGEHVDPNVEDNGYQRTVGGVVRQWTVTMGSAATANATTAAFTAPVGDKTFFGQVTGTGAVTQTQAIYGSEDNAFDATLDPLLCTITLSGTTSKGDACPITRVNFPFYFVVTTNTTGTGATGAVYVND